MNQVEKKERAPQTTSRSQMTFVSFVVILLMSIALIIIMIFPFLLALFIGGFVALLSYPLFKILRARKFGPKTAAVLVTTGITLLIILPFSIFAMLGVQQGIAIIEAINTDSDFSYHTLINLVKESRLVDIVFGSKAAFENQIRSWLQQHGKVAAELVISIAANIPTFLLQLAISLLSCYFFLADGTQFVAWLEDKIPLEPRIISALAMTITSSVSSVVWSTLAAASVQSVIMLIAFLVLSMPAAVFATAATFILAWIPVIGTSPVWLGGAIYLYFFDGSPVKAIIMLGFGVITAISDNIVHPAVLKGRVDMHPLVSLMAIFGGLAMFGLMGVFIGPILAAVLISLLKIWPTVAHSKFVQ